MKTIPPIDADAEAVAMSIALPPSPSDTPNKLTPPVVEAAPDVAATAPPPLPPRPTTEPNTDTQPGDAYAIKEIEFPYSGRRDPRVRILVQDHNGPCPLLALANVLALRGDLVLPLGEAHITYDALAARLAEYLLGVAPTTTEDQSGSLRGGTGALPLDDVLRLLPDLRAGLSLNPCFHDPTAFHAADEARGLFAAYRVPLVHAWTVDPQDAPLWSVLGPDGPGNCFEDASVLAACADDDIGSAPAARLARDFLRATQSSQATVHGLATLATELASPSLPPMICVLFRHHHFYVLTANPRTGALYTLVTDRGYIGVSSVVWESVEPGHNADSTLVGPTFLPVPLIHDDQEAVAIAAAATAAVIGAGEGDDLVPLGVLHQAGTETHQNVDPVAAATAQREAAEWATALAVADRAPPPPPRALTDYEYISFFLSESVSTHPLLLHFKTRIGPSA
ncbi:hypothetical protein BC828DRAFT_174048 [Blastocladiella britannica]|nr:hypothetical protein BC828DRAFT_174048 [Blastocladiella britannica]